MSSKKTDEKALLFLDLDNTMIYSHRHRTEVPVVWVEQLNGRDQSYMTKETFEFFLHQDWLIPVPVTTRTFQQYQRLEGLTEKLGWHTALICNGAILIKDGKEDLSWREESMRLSRTDRKAFQEIRREAQCRYNPEAIVSAEEMLFYIKAEDVEETFAFLKSSSDPAHVAVYRDSRKVYCIPQSLNKGAALRRYASRYAGRYANQYASGYTNRYAGGYASDCAGFPAGQSSGSASTAPVAASTDIFTSKDISRNTKIPLTIAAGDSAFDISMLEAADISFCPPDLPAALEPGKRRIICEGIISDDIRRELVHLFVNQGQSKA